MNNLQIITTGLLIMSTLISLATEAVKKILTEYNKTYRANTLSGVIALVLSTIAAVCYVVTTGTAFTSQVIVWSVMFVFASWLCAMVGYDKVIQTIGQFKGEVTDK